MTAFSDIRYLSHLVGEELAASGVQLATDRDPRHREALLDELKKLPALQSVTARADMAPAALSSGSRKDGRPQGTDH